MIENECKIIDDFELNVKAPNDLKRFFAYTNVVLSAF